MRLVSRIIGAMVPLGLVTGLTLGLTGCDTSGSQTTQSKPIETDILKKLGAASQAQSQAAKAEHSSAGKRKR
jgi:hypothetical protein